MSNALKITLLTALGPLLLTACSNGTSPPANNGPTRDHGFYQTDAGSGDGTHGGDGAASDGATADTGSAKRRTSCKATNQLVVYKDANQETGWLPQIAWSKTQYGITWSQAVTESSLVKYGARFARVSKAGKLLGKVQSLTKANTVYVMGVTAIAELSTGFATVWSDNRTSFSNSDLYFLRLNDKGQRLTSSGAVCTTAGCGELKVTSSTKASYPYLVRRAYVDLKSPVAVNELGLAWADSRSEKSVPYPPYSSGREDIYFKVLKTNGTQKLAEKRVTTSASKTHPGWPRLAYNGGDYAVVWRDLPSIASQELFFAALDSTGTVKGKEKSLTKNYGLLSSPPDLVWSGSEYGITYSANPSATRGSVLFSRITKAGKMLAAQTVISQGNPCTPAIAYNGQYYAIVWQSDCGKTGSQLTFALVDTTGTPVKSDGTSCTGSDPKCGLVTVSTTKDGTASYPEMISVDGNFAVTWMNAPKHEIHFANINCVAP